MLGFSQMAGASAIGHPGSLMTIHIRFGRVSRRARTPASCRIMREARA
jgi:hypothetical protein